MLGGLSGNGRIMFRMTLDGLRGELSQLLEDMGTREVGNEEGKTEE